MLKPLAVLSAAIVLAATAAAQQPTLMGMTLGRPMAESAPLECDRQVQDAVTESILHGAPYPALPTLCHMRQPLGGQYTIYGNPLGGFRAVVDNGDVVMVIFTFPESHGSGLRDGLQRKMGTPTASADIEKQNAMGATFVDHRQAWRTPAMLVTYDSLGDSIGGGEIVASYLPYLAKSAAGDKDDVARTAKSF